MTGQDFIRLVGECFVPCLRKVGFSMEAPSISGRFYRALFTGRNHSVSVSFEPGDDALFVLVFSREGGELSDADDPQRTPRLADLNRRYMDLVSPEERAANDVLFKSIVARNTQESDLLKSAKELCLVLPKYLADQCR